MSSSVNRDRMVLRRKLYANSTSPIRDVEEATSLDSHSASSSPILKRRRRCLQPVELIWAEGQLRPLAEKWNAGTQTQLSIPSLFNLTSVVPSSCRHSDLRVSPNPHSPRRRQPPPSRPRLLVEFKPMETIRETTGATQPSTLTNGEDSVYQVTEPTNIVQSNSCPIGDAPKYCATNNSHHLFGRLSTADICDDTADVSMTSIGSSS